MQNEKSIDDLRVSIVQFNTENVIQNWRATGQLPNGSESFKSLSTGAEKYIMTRPMPLYY